MYVGIDLAKEDSKICIIGEKGEILKEFEIKNNKKGFEKLLSNLKPHYKIGIEASGSFQYPIYFYLKERKFQLYFVNSYKTHKLGEIIRTGIKNDPKDSYVIAKFVQQYPEHTYDVGIKTLELKNLIKLYNHLRHLRTNIIFKLEDNLTILFPEFWGSVFYRPFCATGLKLLHKYPRPQDYEGVTEQEVFNTMKFDENNNIRKVNHRTANMKNARKILDVAKNSVGVRDYPTYYFKRMLKQIEKLDKDIEDARARVEAIVTKSVYAPLLKESGMGVYLLACIIADTGDVRRFKSAKAFSKYCGLDVTVHQSGKTTRTNRWISKKGSKLLRTAFYYMSVGYLKKCYGDNEYKLFYKRLREKGKHSRQAHCAVARKLSTHWYYKMLACHKE